MQTSSDRTDRTDRTARTARTTHRGIGHSLRLWCQSLLRGARLSFGYFWRSMQRGPASFLQDKDYFSVRKGSVTLRYPQEQLPVPDHGRYQLHNEMDDCIVCDRCAKACPVNCIDIEAIRSPHVFGHTSDGTPKRLHAARFDIDMAKCCFCGLCTVVCPTECLTMRPVYDYSTDDIDTHIFAFSTMSPEEIAARQAESQYPPKTSPTKPLMPPATPSVKRPASEKSKQPPPNAS